ncbi:NAD(P)H-dependent glycerol-3-phosphate dehydrogenase [Thiothrix nivea]|uniref:Glycerol-3-phosphate dehydrogenase [NAD(P)+] n=1 Tax=Thiothrix nivea (strain ATCC 35100 / DSM 5205 / JP2) TaxID=870187 RepID=A0A656HDZ5_THINJ|nr:glycerol 3-phosphate dehydrogenase (NAD(P)+) [Thiothrix nivea DSM 5205]
MMTEHIQSIAVYGAGSWGTALALQLARNGLDVLLWDINPVQVETLNRERENTYYLPGIAFPDKLVCSSDLQAVAAFADYHLIVVPSHGFRSLLQKLSLSLTERDAVLWATKGLELDTGKLLHQVLEEELPQCKSYGVVSGPTFAGEVASGLPTAMTVAATNAGLAQAVAEAFQAPNYRVYFSQDILGVELGGAIKNVLAIAAGISDGLGFGANARVAIVTRGLAEIMRLGTKLGAQPETLMGLAGVGDLVLTCTDNQSRNRRLGLALGQGKDMETAIAEIGQAVEGAKSARSIGKLAATAGVEMPICDVVYRILYEQLPPRQAVQELISRDLKAEF